MNPIAVFAMGCFWCSESAFRKLTHEPLEGIISIEAGYAGGALENPTYEHHTGHKEAIRIIFNPPQIAYRTLLEIFWRHIDPFDAGGQFYDRGASYTTAIFYKDLEQRQLALETKQEIETYFGKKCATEILPYTTFYLAEDYHQNYSQKNPERYHAYTCNSGRYAKLQQIWEGYKDY